MGSITAHGPRLRLVTTARLEVLEPRQLFAVSLGSDGWTDITPSADSRVLYVSSSAGSDANSGLSADAPLKSIAKARSLMRDGAPDHMLLRRGDAWTENLASWTQSGRSADEPMLIGAYGAGERPKLNTGTSVGFTNGNGVAHLAILGIHFHAHTRDTDSPSYDGTTVGEYGFRSMGDMRNLLIEDAVFDDYTYNLSITGYESRISDVTLRRSIVTDAWSTDGKSQGMYVHKVDGLLLEENVFDHNGWNTDVDGAHANMYSHGIYMSSDNTDVVVRGNIIADSAAHGLQARSGGIIEHNLFLRNPINLQFGGGSPTVKPGGVSGRITGNVILDTRDINGSNRGTALDLSNIKPGADVTISDNIITADTHRKMAAIRFDTNANATNLDQAVGINDLTMQNNIVYDWYSAFNMTDDFVTGITGRLGVNNVKVIDNDFQFTGSTRLVRHGPTVNTAEFVWEGNRYANYASVSPSGWFHIVNTTTSFSNWKSQVESTAQSIAPAYADPIRSIGTYMASIGETADLASFLGEARQQARGAYDGTFSAAAVINHVRGGFAEDGVIPGGLLPVSGTTTDNPSTPPPGDGGTEPPVEDADTVAPTAPAALDATGASTTSNELRWEASTDNVGVSGYEIFRDGVKIASTTTTSYTDTDLSAGTSYVYKVRAVDGAGNVSAFSNTDTGTTHAAGTAPAAPTSLDVSRRGRRAARLSWTDASADEAGFYVWTSTDNVNWNLYATVDSKSGTGSSINYNTDSFSSGTHYFRVSAFNSFGESQPTDSVTLKL